jgi:hypothetical protein
MFTENKDFYPTPKKLIYKMLDKLKEEQLSLASIQHILEPSCGKGDIVQAYEEYYETNCRRMISYGKKAKDYLKFDVIEFDENLNNLLRGQKYNVVWDNFLTFDPPKFYDLIIMNPPYSEGDKHCLKAIETQERVGGRVLCLLNAETLKNPYNNTRKKLISLIEQYDGDIEYIQNAFSESERETDVETAMVYINVPMSNTETMFEREFKRENPNIHINNLQSLIPNMNKLEKLVFEFNVAKNASIELFKEQMRVSKLLSGFGVENVIRLCDDKVHADKLTVNGFIAHLTLKYWNKFIEETEFKKKLPTKLRDNFSCNMEKQQNIAFTIENVRYFYEELIQAIPKSYEETVARVFDDLTYKSYYSDTMWNKNIYLFSGWKTNSCYKINNKSIIGYYGNYLYRVPDTLNDLNIIFNNIKGTKYNIDTNEIVEAIKRCDKNIETEHFILDCYQKQTIHIKYKNKQHLEIFNILSGKGKNWLPPDFATKKYEDMDETEKKLVKDFGLTVQEYDGLRITSGTNNYLRLG